MKSYFLRLIVATFVIMLTFVFVVGCGAITRSPAQTVEQFYRAVENGEIDNAMEMLTDQAINSVGGDKIKRGLATQTQQIQQRGGIESVEILSENIVGQTADLKVQITYADQHQQAVNVKLIEEDNRWKIDTAK